MVNIQDSMLGGSLEISGTYIELNHGLPDWKTTAPHSNAPGQPRKLEPHVMSAHSQITVPPVPGSPAEAAFSAAPNRHSLCASLCS